MVAMANEDKDFSTVDALPDPDAQPTPAAQTDAVATAIQNTAVGIGTAAGGKTPEAVAADAAAAATETRNLAESAATVGAAIRVLKAAAAAWRKNAPKKKDFDAAEKAVTDAKAALATAQQAEDDSLSDGAKALATQQVKTASDALEKALTHLRKITAERKAADEAFDREHKKAVAKLKGLRSGDEDRDGDSPGAPGKPATPGATSTGAPAARTGSGTPAAKPSGTPAATPSAEKPTTSTSSASTLTPAETAALVTAAQGQQNQQQPQAQQAAQQQMPTMPTMPTVPQQNQQQNKDSDKTLQSEAERNSAQALAAAGLGGLVTGSISPSVSSTSQSTPTASANSTTFRGPDAKITGVGLGGAPAVNAQNPVTSGSSAAGLTTPSDVGGRSTPAATAFSPSPGTHTSGATDTATQQQSGQQQTGRPMGSGMPGMMPLSPGAAGPSYGSPATKDKDGKVIAYGGNPQSLILNGWPALEDSVKGGTICQALNQENQARISV